MTRQFLNLFGPVLGKQLGFGGWGRDTEIVSVELLLGKDADVEQLLRTVSLSC